MKKNVVSILFLVVFFLVIKGSHSQINDPVSLKINIEAINLSEDASVLSSQDDELIMFLYAYDDTALLSEPLLKCGFKTKVNQRKDSIIIDSLHLTAEYYILFFIERDSERSLQQIDPVLRIHYKEIIEAFRTRNYTEAEKFFEDEDLLGYAIIKRSEFADAKELLFKGLYKLDSYEYKIRLRFYSTL